MRAWSLVAIRVTALGVACVAAEAAAQTPEESVPAGFSSVPFRFAPPGARALAIGGAFIAVADDATAGEANPAGLIHLSRPEVSLHGSSSHFDVEILDPAALTAPSPGFPLVPSASFEESIPSVTYASLVWPFERWAVSGYYQQVSRFRGERFIDRTSQFPPNSSFPGQTLNVDSFQDLDFVLDSLGAAVAFKPIDRLSLGVSIRRSRLSWRNIVRFTQELGLRRDGSGTQLTFFGTNFVLDEADDQDANLTFNAGLILNPGGKVSLGGVFKKGGHYTIPATTSYLFFALEDDFPTSAADFRCPPETLPRPSGVRCFASVGNTKSVAFDVPDFYGAGIVARPIQQLLVATDVNLVTYSDLESTADFGVLSGVNLQAVDDGIELHLGVEYTVFVGKRHEPLALRAGWFHESDHDGLADVDSSQNHYTGGLGVVLSNRMQIDAAGHYSRTVKEVLLSFVYRF